MLLIYTLCRFLFWWLNSDYFSEVGLGVFWGGFIYDLAAIFMWNLLFAFLSLVPFPIREKKGYQRFLTWVFYIINLPALALQLIDMEYFKFTLKRSTSDLIDLAGYGNDMQQLVPVFLKHYWYLPIFGIVLTVIIMRLYKRTRRKPFVRELFSFAYLVRHTFIMLISLGLMVLMARGGIQPKPLSAIDAGRYSIQTNMPLVLNTPFTMLTSFFKQGVKPTHYFTDSVAEGMIQPIRHYSQPSGEAFRQMNVVIIMLESFSREYIGGYNEGQAFTPFIDSLMEHSMVYDLAYANGKTSIQAVPNVTAAIPSLMSAPYISSTYADNYVTSLPSLLNEQGYQTAFYHGATNGSMRFDGFSSAIGFDEYLGRTEYNNDDDYDGQWGIWDEEFFQYFANGLNATEKPALGVVFSLTSHQPFEVPEQYKDAFPKGDIPILETVAYTDYSLGQFFKTVSQFDWYENTLFVITADHTGPKYSDQENNRRGQLAIPLIFHHPGSNFVGRDTTTLAQQIDILPTVMDYLNYKEPFFCFGESLLSYPDKRRYNITQWAGVFQIISNDYVLQFDGEDVIGFYRLTDDWRMRRNLTKEVEYAAHIIPEDYREKTILLNHLKAYIQVYNNRMIKNELTAR